MLFLKEYKERKGIAGAFLATTFIVATTGENVLYGSCDEHKIYKTLLM